MLGELGIQGGLVTREQLDVGTHGVYHV
jgi:hypothetical protein